VYELIILSFLRRWPMHGYVMVKIINDMIGPFAKASIGRLYPLLTKLEGEGLIVVADDTLGGQARDRRQRTYQITEAGRARFHQLMMDTTSNPGEYSKFFWQKVMFLDLLTPNERLYLLDHYLTYCQAHIFHVRGQMDELTRDVARQQFMDPTQLDVTLRAMEHYLEHWRLELAQAQSWRERVAATAPAP